MKSYIIMQSFHEELIVRVVGRNVSFLLDQKLFQIVNGHLIRISVFLEVSTELFSVFWSHHDVDSPVDNAGCVPEIR